VLRLVLDKIRSWSRWLWRRRVRGVGAVVPAERVSRTTDEVRVDATWSRLDVGVCPPVAARCVGLASGISDPAGRSALQQAIAEAARREPAWLAPRVISPLIGLARTGVDIDARICEPRLSLEAGDRLLLRARSPEATPRGAAAAD